MLCKRTINSKDFIQNTFQKNHNLIGFKTSFKLTLRNFFNYEIFLRSAIEIYR